MNTQTAGIAETKNYILMHHKPGERIMIYRTHRGNDLDIDILHHFAAKGLLRREVGGPESYGHIDFFRRENQ